MIKKIILSLLFVNFVFADNFTLDQLRTNQVIELEANLDDISKKTENYIISTADINVDKQKLINKFSLPINYFNNLEGNQLNYTFDNVKKTIYISNIFGSSGNEFIQSNLLSNSTISKVFSSNNNYDVTYYLSPTTSNFVSLVQKINLNPNIVLSLTQPSDTTKTWYQPLGNGSFKVSNFISSWTQSGTSDPINNAAIQVSSIDLLNKIACIINDQGFVNDGTKADIYVCTNNNTWVKINMGSTSMYNGDTNVLALITTLLDSPGGSIGNVEDPNQTGVKNLFSGFKKFTKRDSTFGSLKGYWLDDTKTFIVAETLNDLSTKTWANGVYAYILNNAKNNVVLLQRINNSWMTISDGYNGVVLSEKITTLTYDKKNNKYFKYRTAGINNGKDYWEEVNSSGTLLNTMYLTSNSNGRLTFPIPYLHTKGYQYLTLNNDCKSDSSDCYGLSGTQYFAGEKLDNMYVYYYTTSGKRENNLIDAIPATSVTDIYNRNLLAGLYQGVVYFKSLDSLGRTCYTKPVDNTWWTKAGVSIPTGNNLPSSVTCETATYSGTNLILPTRTAATDWTTAPNLAGVYITASSSNYVHKLSGSLDFWTNNGSGDGQANATEIFTKGNRTSFPVVTHTINALTKLVDTPNMIGGEISTIDNTFKIWYYDTTNINKVNNLIDVYELDFPIGTLTCNDKNIGEIINYKGGKQVYVAGTISDIQTKLFVDNWLPLSGKYICTSKVIDMSNLFNANIAPYQLNKKNFNADLSNWDTSNVTNMSSMFNSSWTFNMPIGNWNVSKVTDMSFMFASANKFNQNINSWNVSSVNNMASMFKSIVLFNQPISSWNTSNVTNMSSMFNNAGVFNQPIGSWNTSNVTNMSSMFNFSKFNMPIGNWNVSKVTDMSNMFSSTSLFNQDLSNWNTSNVINMSNMFYNAVSFNQNLSTWCVTKIPTLPSGFLSNNPSWIITNRLPIWGTCP